MEIRNKIESNITISETTNVYGMIIGNVIVDNLLILNGTILGNITLTRNGIAQIYGTVTGNIYNMGKCTIYGIINGNISSHHNDIKIDEKAIINGRILLMDVIRTENVHPEDLKSEGNVLLRGEIERRIIKNSQEDIKTRIDVYSSRGSSDPTIYECIYKKSKIETLNDCEFIIIRL